MESKINERGAAVGTLVSEAAPAATCSRWHCDLTRRHGSSDESGGLSLASRKEKLAPPDHHGNNLRINTRIYVNVTSRTAVAFCAGTPTPHSSADIQNPSDSPNWSQYTSQNCRHTHDDFVQSDPSESVNLSGHS